MLNCLNIKFIISTKIRLFIHILYGPKSAKIAAFLFSYNSISLTHQQSTLFICFCLNGFNVNLIFFKKNNFSKMIYFYLTLLVFLMGKCSSTSIECQVGMDAKLVIDMREYVSKGYEWTSCNASSSWCYSISCEHNRYISGKIKNCGKCPPKLGRGCYCADCNIDYCNYAFVQKTNWILIVLSLVAATKFFFGPFHASIFHLAVLGIGIGISNYVTLADVAPKEGNESDLFKSHQFFDYKKKPAKFVNLYYGEKDGFSGQSASIKPYYALIKYCVMMPHQIEKEKKKVLVDGCLICKNNDDNIVQATLVNAWQAAGSTFINCAKKRRKAIWLFNVDMNMKNAPGYFVSQFNNIHLVPESVKETHED